MVVLILIYSRTEIIRSAPLSRHEADLRTERWLNIYDTASWSIREEEV